ncbi:MAG: HEPN domain-containing protein [Nanoarchaeota archaeon]
MRKTDFLHKLAKEKKLQVVEPSEEMRIAYLQRAQESLSSAKALLKIGNLKDSVALAYYSMYHALLSLLFRSGIKCENHTAAIILLKEIFNLDNAVISKAKSERVDKQYYIDFAITKEEVMKSIHIAEEFIIEINNFTENLTEDKIKEYRSKTVKRLQ